MPSIKEIIWVDLPSVHDKRGVLTAIESGIDIPFDIKRIFYMHNVKMDRGGHAHINTDQVVVAVSGSFRIEAYDGTMSADYILNDPERGLFIPKMIFVNLLNFSSDAVCLVLSSTHYDINKSIRNIDDYNKAIREHK